MGKSVNKIRKSLERKDKYKDIYDRVETELLKDESVQKFLKLQKLKEKLNTKIENLGYILENTCHHPVWFKGNDVSNFYEGGGEHLLFCLCCRKIKEANPSKVRGIVVSSPGNFNKILKFLSERVKDWNNQREIERAVEDFGLELKRRKTIN